MWLYIFCVNEAVYFASRYEEEELIVVFSFLMR